MVNLANYFDVMPRWSVQLLQPTQVIAPFATTAAAQTLVWSSSTSSSRGLRASPAHVCLHQKYNSCYSTCTCTYFLSNNSYCFLLGKGIPCWSCLGAHPLFIFITIVYETYENHSGFGRKYNQYMCYCARSSFMKVPCKQTT